MNGPATALAPTRAGSSRDWRDALHEERMAHLIKTAFRCTSASLQRRLKQHDVLYGHWTFLRILWQTDGVTQRQLSEQAGVTEPSTVTALQAMEKLGYVTRRKIDGNKKQIRVFLTPKGRSLRSLIVPCAQQVNQIVMAGIPAEDLAVTRRTLLAVIENLSRDGLDEADRPE
ncbi:MAG: transcriptional regulator MarR family [Ramlibacter sp.]|nr:transcriptional regulator MarR family [Ramlibacter sp.]